MWDRFVLRAKRGEGKPFRLIRALYYGFHDFSLPPLPGPLRTLARLAYEFHYFVLGTTKWVLAVFYYQPLLQSRCERVGRRLRVRGMPFVLGHTAIRLGDEVLFNGKVDIISGRFHDRPELIVGNRASIGHSALLSVNQRIEIEDDVIISYECRLSDSDGHPREADLRAQSAPLDLRDIRPIRICRHAWIGNGTHIMKGVTIGEGAIIGANSVVVSDIPPYSIAFGNPAEVYFRNVGRPKRAARAVSS